MTPKRWMRSNERWSDSDVAFLEKNWGVASDKVIAEHLGRSAKAINSKRLRLLIQHTTHQGRWRGKTIRTAEEFTADLSEPIERYHALQQRHREVMECFKVALVQSNQWRWAKVMMRLNNIRAELKEAMMVEVGRMG